MKKYKLLFALILIAVGAIAFFYFYKQKTQDKYNLVVFDADVFRADGIDCENHPDITPNLCEVQDEFIKFNNHHSQSDLTRPAMASFLTSSYPTTHGVWNEFFFLNKKQPNITSLLKESGYNTMFLGDIHNSQVIYDFYGKKIELIDSGVSETIKDKPTFLFIYNSNLHHPYLSFDSKTILNYPGKPDNFPNNMSEFHENADEFLVKNYPDFLRKPIVSGFINKQDGSIKGIYAYFQYLCNDADVSIRLVSIDACQIVVDQTFEQYLDRNNPDHLEFIKYLYQERIRAIDRVIGTIIHDLKSSGLWEKTVFAIRSDHGEEFMEHDNLNHWNNLYQELVEVPLWIHVPGQKGKTISSLTQTIDEAPTLLSALGIDPHSLMQGRNLLDSNNYDNQIDFAIAQKLFGLISSVRDGDFKLIIVNDSESGDAFYELYNLKDDPDEKNNIVEENQDIKEELISKYYNTINQQPRFKSNNVFEKLTGQQKSNMYEGGYF